jgi:methionyl-tRNA formyltransferase
MRIAFFGSTRFSCLVLEMLRQGPHEIAAVVTQPDQPAGRRLELTPTALCCSAAQLGLPVLKPERLVNNSGFRQALAAHKPDALIVASYGRILPPKVLGLTEWPLNVHPSPLPRLRGASPIRATLLQGLERTECCIMRMTPRMDDGDILRRAPLAIPVEWNFLGLITQMARLGGLLATQALDDVAAGSVTLEPQDGLQATYCTVYTREDTVIDWRRGVNSLRDFVRAWDPDLGALTALPGGRRLKVWAVSTVAPPDNAVSLAGHAGPGVVAALTKRHFWVAAGNGLLRIDEVQPENKARMPAANFLAGARLKPGDTLCDPLGPGAAPATISPL